MLADKHFLLAALTAATVPRENRQHRPRNELRINMTTHRLQMFSPSEIRLHRCASLRSTETVRPPLRCRRSSGSGTTSAEPIRR